MKKTLIFPFLLILTFAFFVPAAFGSQFAGVRNYVLNKDEAVSGNLYAGGTNVIISGGIDGDLFAGGSNVLISGDVREDIAAAGNTINIGGNVGGDVRAAGGTILFDGQTKGEVLVAAGQLYVSSGASVYGDFTAGAGAIIIDGNLAGKVRLSASEIVINGQITGDASVTANKSLTIGSSAVIGGNLDYKSPKTAVIREGAQIRGKTTYTKPEATKKYAVWQRTALKAWFGFVTLAWLAHLLGMIAAALLAYFLFRKATEAVIWEATGHFGGELIRGFLWLVALPVAAVIALITLVGAVPALVALVIYAAVLLIAFVYAGPVLGSLVFRLFAKNKEFSVNWKTVAIGAILYQITKLIPFVGWIFTFVIFLAVLGTLFSFLHRLARNQK